MLSKKLVLVEKHISDIMRENSRRTRPPLPLSADAHVTTKRYF